MFWKAKISMKRKCYVFIAYKVMCKFQQDRYCWWFSVKMVENGRKNILGEKETTKKIPPMSLDAKVLTEGNNCIFWLYQ